MSAPAKRTLFALIAAILMAALSSVFAITLSRLTRQHAESDSNVAQGRRLFRLDSGGVTAGNLKR